MVTIIQQNKTNKNHTITIPKALMEVMKWQKGDVLRWKLHNKTKVLILEKVE